MISSLALVVVIVIDQFRTDELLRAQQSLSPAGIGLLINKGIFYDDAHHSQFFNMTCPGHVSLSTGAMPGLHGIMLNNDWDASTQKDTYCVADPNEHWLGGEEDTKDGYYGSSGKRILTTTVGDELKTLYKDQSKVISISLKDRAAIGMAGHRADGVYWFGQKSKIWTTSSAYNKSGRLPVWVENFNKKLNSRKDLDDKDYGKTPAAVDDETSFALTAIDAESLGKHAKPDLLWLSYSTHDFVAHTKGDDSTELKTIIAKEDQGIARIIAAIQKKLGKKKFIVALSADHGAGFDTASDASIPGGKINNPLFLKELNDCLVKSGVKAPENKPVALLSSSSIFLSDKIKDKKDARIKTKICLNTASGPIWQAYTREEILGNQIPQTPWLKNLVGSYNPSRGADVIAVLNPYWNTSDDHILTHETSYDYDSWVPLAIWFNGIKKQQVHKRVDILSLAPTLSRIFETRRPSGAMSEYLTEVLDSAK
jgi:arylsulfatase A-like enzyme